MKLKKGFTRRAAGFLFAGFVCAGLFSVHAAAKEYTENSISYTIRNGEAIVQSCKSKETTVTIPSSVNGYEVTTIGTYAFSNSKYTKIQLPETIVKISDGAFSNCDQLTSIALPEHVAALGNYAFYSCAKLKRAELNQNLRKISDNTFYQCISLKSVTLPKKLEVIGTGAFDQCYKLSGITLGKGVEKIGERAFRKNFKMTYLSIPSRVSYVGRQAFYDCRNLRKAVFKTNRISAGDGVFQKCTLLSTVRLPKYIKTIPEDFFAETGLKTFQLPEKVTIVKAGAFRQCARLKKFSMNQKVYALGDKVFANSALESIRFNQNMQYIGNRAFLGTRVKNIALPKRIMYIGNRVFAECKKLKRIRIPAGVKGINPRAFNHCTSLRSVVVAVDNARYSSAQGVLYNKNKTRLIQYPLHKQEKNFTVPGSVKVIRAHAFEENKYLQTVTVGAKMIGIRAFADMKKLKKVTLLRGVEMVKERAFEENLRLKTVQMADTVKAIEHSAFYHTGLTSVSIPKNLKVLGRNVFYRCDDLVAFRGGTGSYFKVRDGVLYNGKGTTLIQYPGKKKDRTFTVPDQVTDLKKYSFYHVSRLRKLLFGNRIQRMPYGSIDSCNKLRSVVFASGTKLSSGYAAIRSCKNLAVIVGTKDDVFRSMASYVGATLITL